MSFTGLEWAIQAYRKNGDNTPPTALLVSLSITNDAYLVLSKHELDSLPYIIPCPGLPTDFWMLTGPNGVVFSNP